MTGTADRLESERQRDSTRQSLSRWKRCRHGLKEVSDRLNRGDTVDPEPCSFRSTIPGGELREARLDEPHLLDRYRLAHGSKEDRPAFLVL
jgi:hypothetical protein